MAGKGIEREYMSVKELSEYSGICVRSLRDLLKGSNPIPSFKFGNSVRVKKSEFDRWAETCRNDKGRINQIVEEILTDGDINAKPVTGKPEAELSKKSPPKAAKSGEACAKVKAPADIPTRHKLIIADCKAMTEIADSSIHLVLTSPPYFNAPFDYDGLYSSYEEYLEFLERLAGESFRVLQQGRIAALNIDDMLVRSVKFPLLADAIKAFQKAGFRYRDRIEWKKPDGFTRPSKRSGVLLQHPYPMYFYPSNLMESIVIFQKGKFDYRSIPKEIREKSKIDTAQFLSERLYNNHWEMTNVLPDSEMEKGIAAFPEMLAYRIIVLFSHWSETVLDPCAGSGTTTKVARQLRRNSIAYGIKKDLIRTIRRKSGFDIRRGHAKHDTFEVLLRNEDSNGRNTT